MEETIYSPDILGVIIQGGAVGICVLLLILNFWKDKIFSKTVNNHIQHSTDAINNLTAELARSSTCNTNLIGTLERMNDHLKSKEAKEKTKKRK